MSLWRIYLVEAKYECLRMLRAPGFSIPFLGLPVLLYLLFGVLIFGNAARSDPSVGKFLFGAFAVVGVAGVGMFGFGVGLAIEREQGYLRFKRALPMPPAAHLVAKVAMAMLFALLIVITMTAAAVPFGHLALTAGELFRFAAVCVLGSVAFCAAGLCIGARVSARAAPAVVNLVYLPMLHLGGLFYPLPAFLAAAAPIWPVYHLHQLALAALGAPHRGESAIHVAILAAEALVFGLLAIRRRDHD